MKICALIAEFNPFHNGHAYLINEIRKAGFTHILVIMSGNFVQRGETAIFSKEIRTKMALKSGVNLVIEFPTVKVLSTAEKYALSGLDIIKKTGVSQAIACAAECENINTLVDIKNFFKDEKFHFNLKKYLDKGITFAQARELSLMDVIQNKEICNKIKTPNNILAVEYLKAIDKLNFKISPFIFKRMENPKKYRSATQIRNFILNKNLEYKKYVPAEINFPLNAAFDYFSKSKEIIPTLRRIEKSDFSKLPDISEGLENRIYNAVKNSCSLQELLFNIKTKRYTLSRIKRLILCSFLGIENEMSNLKIPYLRVLGSDKKGFEILKNINFPVVTRYSDLLKLSSSANEFFELENKFTNLYFSLTNKILPCEQEKTFQMIKG